MKHMSLVSSPFAGEARSKVDDADADLVHRVADGDLSALGVLYDRHHQHVRQFVGRATAFAADTDDLTHETFLTLAKVAAKYDERRGGDAAAALGSSARPFLVGIAAQLVRRRKRGLFRWKQMLGAFAGVATQRATATPEEAASGSQELRRFDEALARLTDEKRLVFLLVEREGLSGDEVARALEIPVNTVWTRLHHTRAELRRALGREAAP